MVLLHVNKTEFVLVCLVHGCSLINLFVDNQEEGDVVQWDDSKRGLNKERLIGHKCRWGRQ